LKVFKKVHQQRSQKYCENIKSYVKTSKLSSVPTKLIQPRVDLNWQPFTQQQ